MSFPIFLDQPSKLALCGLWMYTIPADCSRDFTPQAATRITNVCLRLPVTDDAKGTFSYAPEGHNQMTLAILHQHSCEQRSLDVVLQAGKTYTLTSSGPFSIDLIGYYEHSDIAGIPTRPKKGNNAGENRHPSPPLSKKRKKPTGKNSTPLGTRLVTATRKVRTNSRRRNGAVVPEVDGWSGSDEAQNGEGAGGQVESGGAHGKVGGYDDGEGQGEDEREVSEGSEGSDYYDARDESQDQEGEDDDRGNRGDDEDGDGDGYQDDDSEEEDNDAIEGEGGGDDVGQSDSESDSDVERESGSENGIEDEEDEGEEDEGEEDEGEGEDDEGEDEGEDDEGEDEGEDDEGEEEGEDDEDEDEQDEGEGDEGEDEEEE